MRLEMHSIVRHSREEVAIEALNLGADRYLQKRGNPKAQYGVLADAIIQEIENWKVERELKRIKGGAQELLDTYPNMIFFLDKNNRFLRVNKTLADSLGMPKGQIEGKKLEGIFPKEQVEKMRKTNREVIETGEPKINVIEQFETSNGTRWRRTDKLPLNDENGKTQGIIGFAQDITEIKELEERENFLLSLLRHDLKNKNEIALGYQEVLKENNLPENLEKYVSKTIDAIKKSINLIEKVSMLQKRERREETGKVDLNSCISNAIEDCNSQASEMGIQIKYEGENWKVQGGEFLEKIFSNLIENSIFHSKCSIIKISVHEENQECIISIEDDGKGIPDEDKNKIFERGYKKGKSGGSGLGLYLVKEIAESYGGSVKVADSDLGGVKFVVYLKKA